MHLSRQKRLAQDLVFAHLPHLPQRLLRLSPHHPRQILPTSSPRTPTTRALFPPKAHRQPESQSHQRNQSTAPIPLAQPPHLHAKSNSLVAVKKHLAIMNLPGPAPLLQVLPPPLVPAEPPRSRPDSLATNRTTL
jgi:hypothetical protein